MRKSELRRAAALCALELLARQRMPAAAASEVARRDRRTAPERVVGDDVGHYVAAFKASSDHARYALFVVIIATVLMAIATYNQQSWSWPRRRLAALYDTRAIAHELRNQQGPRPGVPLDNDERLRKIAVTYMGGDVERLKIAREEYLKQYQARSVFNSSPIPGASIDMNDLGVVGGIALVLLMLVLVISLTREHENLRLALFKVRHLCSLPGEEHADGNSSANLLYHSLAMSQVLSSPPTLARWQRRGMMHHLWIVLFLPAVAHAWTMWTDWHTRGYAKPYGADVDRLMAAEGVIAVFLWGLSLLALSYARAMTQRWQRAFFRVNPHREHIDQMAWWHWLKLKIGRPRGENWQAGRVITELVDTIREHEGEILPGTVVEVVQPIYPYSLAKRVPISRALVKDMEEQLRREGEASAECDCVQSGREFDRLERFKVQQNVLDLRGRRWTVRGIWTYRAWPSANRGS